MTSRQLIEHPDVQVPVRGRRPPPRTDLTGSASFVLALQRSAGNAAVVRTLTQPYRPVPRSPQPVSPASVTRLHLQRCGPVPCDCSDEERAEYAARVGNSVQRWVGSDVVWQRVPGDGMLPPGDCSWGTYLPLRLSVESAKAVVSMLGACAPGDSCLFLATKIAAITAEIAARVALDATCFKGGDTGHRQQVQDKINMVNRCYRFFQGSNCSQDLIPAMEAVVASARAVIEAAAMAAAAAVIIAAVAALVVAIGALLEVIAAAAAAAAESAAVGAAVAALLALVISIQDSLSSAPAPSS